MHFFIFALTLDLIQKSALLPLYALFGDPIDGCSDTQMKRGDSTPFTHPILHLTSTLTDTYILQPPYFYSTPTLACTPYSYLSSHRAECSPAYHLLSPSYEAFVHVTSDQGGGGAKEGNQIPHQEIVGSPKRVLSYHLDT